MSFLIIASLLSGYVSQGNDYIYRQLKETNPLERTMFSLSPKVSHAFFMSLLWPLFMCLNAAPQLRFIQFFICFLGCFLSSIIPFGIMFLLNLLIKQPLYISGAGALFAMILFRLQEYLLLLACSLNLDLKFLLIMLQDMPSLCQS